MIYVKTITIPARQRWGDVFSDEVTLPTKIYSLKSVAATVTADFARSVVTRDEMGNPTMHRVSLVADPLIYHKAIWDEPSNNNMDAVCDSQTHTMQTGVIAASVNDYGIIGELPAYITSLIHNSCWNRNRRAFDGRTLVRPGSILRLTYQERLASPFVYDEVLGGYPEYKVKFYIEYASK